MTLLRSFSGSKPQRGEDRVDGGPISLTLDPFLHTRQAFGGLMDVVAIDIREGFEQLFEAFGATEDGRCRVTGSASRRARRRPHSLVLTHPTAFLRGCSVATQSPPVAG
jgi:hypothetical protein